MKSLGKKSVSTINMRYSKNKNNNNNGYNNNNYGYNNNNMADDEDFEQQNGSFKNIRGNKGYYNKNKQIINCCREKGNYSAHDMIIARSVVNVITWRGTRIIGMENGGVFYFGADAIRQLEQQISYMYPMERGSTSPDDSSFSFGIVPHTHRSNQSVSRAMFEASFLCNDNSNKSLQIFSAKDSEVVVGIENAKNYIYNFITNNIYPALIEIYENTPGLVPIGERETAEDINYMRAVDMFTITPNSPLFFLVNDEIMKLNVKEQVIN